MKILLDEDLPLSFKSEISGKGHQVFTVKDMKWVGVKNGILLKAMVKNGFECFITNDKNLSKQQPLSQFEITVLLLDSISNNKETLQQFAHEINKKLNSRLRKGLIVIRL